MHQSLLIYSPIGGYLGRFQVFGNEEQSSKHLCIQVLFGHKFLVLLSKYQGAQLLECMVRVCFFFVRNDKLSSKVAVQFIFPSAMNKNFFLLLLIVIVFGGVSFVDFSHSNRCVEINHRCVHLHCLNDRCCTSFHMLICHLQIFFGEVSVRLFCPFLSWVLLFPCC